MRGWAGGIIVALCLLAATPGRGQAPADHDQFLLSADQVTYDEESGRRRHRQHRDCGEAHPVGRFGP
jgi:hypothetical protein